MDQPAKTRTCSTPRCKYVEPAMLLATFAVGILSTMNVNLIEMQYCRYHLKIYEESVCLNKTGSHFSEIQQYTAIFQTITLTFSSIVPGIISTFMGPWSDLHGRRPLMMSGSAGTLMTIILLMWATYAELHPNYMILFDAPMSLSGSGVIVILGIFCHVCDQTTIKERAFRLGILQCFHYIGSIVGTSAAPFLRSFSYTFALFISGCILLILNVYIIFFLKESLVKKTQEENVSKNPFQWSHLRNLFETCYTKQPPSVVKIFVSAGLLIFFSSIEHTGEAAILYMYLQKDFGWTMEVWTNLQIIMTLVSAFLSFALTSKYLRLGDLHVVALVIAIRIVSAFTLFLSRDPWTIYTACIFGSISGVNRLSLRSYLSKVFSADEVGKVYAVCSLLECFGSLFGSFIYGPFYRKTLELNISPKLVFIISIFLCLTMGVQMAMIAYFNKRYVSKDKKADTPPMVLPTIN